MTDKYIGREHAVKVKLAFGSSAHNFAFTGNLGSVCPAHSSFYESHDNSAESNLQEKLTLKNRIDLNLSGFRLGASVNYFPFASNENN